ncbi:U4/U6.U5 tri-snRNP-associated protein 2 [Smittium culicis]|uniref:U4/U6.U5 tri-snRNP-associated protein 2 n=1 Tax=Smittium culicis TaxID=133412 RepID=A0A1R1YCU1_9FUNG|nr:U4/U6.U5 tri-snRNP-associated protein 2 [Smittium culicis]
MTDSTEKRSRSNSSSSSHSEESDHSQLLKKSKDLYLDSVDRSCLDFDFEKICSVTLSDQNVYSCLVCGQYYQGISFIPTLFISFSFLSNTAPPPLILPYFLQVYILPENYEVFDESFNDIKAVIDPRYTEQDVLSLDKTYSISYDLNRSKYRPGFVGLNNIKANDYINVIIQALAHIPIIRNMLLLYPNSTTPAPISSSEPNNNNINTNHKTISHPPSKKIHPQNSELLSRFSLLVRKMWHKNSFKSHVSPHELIQEITNRSNKAFRLDAQGDAFEFLTWFLNSIHFDLIKSANYNSAPKNKKSKLKSKSKHSIIHSAFQGSVKVISQDINFVKVRSYQEDPLEIDEENEITTKISPFLTLGLDLPPPPLFRKEDDTVIPQTSLMTLLKKYNGSHVTELKDQAKIYEILELPKYLIIHIKRFVKNNFTLEKNPTIVNSSIKNVAFGDLIKNTSSSALASDKSRLFDLIVNITYEGNSSVIQDSESQSSSNFYNGSGNSSSKKKSVVGSTGSGLVMKSSAKIPSALPTTSSSLPGEKNSDLSANNFSFSKPTPEFANNDSKASATVLPLSGRYVCHVNDKSTDQWYSINDLIVEPINPQMIFLPESYIQIWERKD